MEGIAWVRQAAGITLLKRIENEGMDFAAHNSTMTYAMNVLKSFWSQYRFFVFLNSSIKGPFTPKYYPFHWSEPYLSRIDDKTKAVGSSIVCLPEVDAGVCLHCVSAHHHHHPERTHLHAHMHTPCPDSCTDPCPIAAPLRSPPHIPCSTFALLHGKAAPRRLQQALLLPTSAPLIDSVHWFTHHSMEHTATAPNPHLHSTLSSPPCVCAHLAVPPQVGQGPSWSRGRLRSTPRASGSCSPGASSTCTPASSATTAWW